MYSIDFEARSLEIQNVIEWPFLSSCTNRSRHVHFMSHGPFSSCRTSQCSPFLTQLSNMMTTPRGPRESWTSCCCCCCFCFLFFCCCFLLLLLLFFLFFFGFFCSCSCFVVVVCFLFLFFFFFCLFVFVMFCFLFLVVILLLVFVSKRVVSCCVFPHIRIKTY